MAVTHASSSFFDLTFNLCICCSFSLIVCETISEQKEGMHTILNTYLVSSAQFLPQFIDNLTQPMNKLMYE